LFNIFSRTVKSKLHTKNQSPSLLNAGYSFEENLNIGIWKKNYWNSFFTAVKMKIISIIFSTILGVKITIFVKVKSGNLK